MNKFQARLETWEGEGLKSVAETALQTLGRSALGQDIIERYAFGFEGRIVDPALHTVIAGIDLENPVMFGAGWDKKGRCVNGLYRLGFSAGEVGTVLPFGQAGAPKPRLWTIDEGHSVGLNRMGFNSPGMEAVRKYLEAGEPIPMPIGINISRNKEIENDKAAWAHAKVIKHLGPFASYFALGISSPNTKDLRSLQSKEPFRELIQQAYAAMDHRVPLFAKIDSEREYWELDDMIEVALEEGLSGFVATNTYMSSDLKAHYGERWANEAGGLSGNDPRYRARATATVRHIYESAGDRLTVIGVGGVGDASTALDKIKAGASAVQVVTAIRPTKGKVAAHINQGLLDYMRQEGIQSIRELIGADTSRGTA